MVTESGCVDGIVGTNVDIVSTATDSDFGDDSADGWFPESVAADYDAPGGANDPGVVEPMVEVLAELAGDGAVLELAVGTGRIAAPLAARGLDVKRDRAQPGDGGAHHRQAGR